MFITIIAGNNLFRTFSRELAESSPYFEALKAKDVEVLFTYEETDEVVFAALKEFQKKDIVSAENYLMADVSSPDSDVITDENQGRFYFLVILSSCLLPKADPRFFNHFLIVTEMASAKSLSK